MPMGNLMLKRSREKSRRVKREKKKEEATDKFLSIKFPILLSARFSKNDIREYKKNRLGIRLKWFSDGSACFLRCNLIIVYRLRKNNRSREIRGGDEEMASRLIRHQMKLKERKRKSGPGKSEYTLANKRLKESYICFGYIV